jgi:hypothetical protein
MSKSARQFDQNWFKSINDYTDIFMRYLTGAEYKTLQFAMRFSYGPEEYGPESEYHASGSIERFMDGDPDLENEYGTGLSELDQRLALNVLVSAGLMRELENGEFALDTTGSRQINYDLLKARWAFAR